MATSSVSGENRGYAYDSAWNLNYRMNNGVLGTFLVDTKNELTNAPNPMGTMLYDANGNLTSANGQYSYSYDAENRLSLWLYAQFGAASLTNGDLVSRFAYDGLSRLRVRQEYTLVCGGQQTPFSFAGSLPSPPLGCDWVLTSETHYIYDGYRVIQERDSNNVPVVSYTRGTDLSGTLEGAGGIGGLLGRSSGYSSGNWTTHAFYHADGGGNITYLVDGNQSLAASYRYDPFGNTVASSGALASANVYRFSSKEIHANSGMYYFLYRFYDPNLQRWINRDPIGEFGGLNLYVYAGNGPLDFVDSVGLLEFQVTFGLGGTVFFWAGGLHAEANVGVALNLSDLGDSKLFGHAQGALLAGQGAGFMGGRQVGGGISKEPLKPGFSECGTLHIEGGFGWGDAQSASIDARFSSFGGVKDMGGAGYGLYLGAGPAANVTYATPSVRDVVNTIADATHYSRYDNGVIFENRPSIYPP